MTATPSSRNERRGESLRRLAKGIEVLTGRPATALAVRQFEQYLDLLTLWNRSQRLTGVLSPADIVKELFEDSLLFLGRLPPGELKVADIGAGAGIPGVPMAIVRPEISLTLIEAKRKRVSFLSTVRRELGVANMVVLEGRAESLIRTNAALAEAFDVVVSRAVGPIDELVPLAKAYLKRGGMFVAGSGPTAHRRPACDGMELRYEAQLTPGSGRPRTLALALKADQP